MNRTYLAALAAAFLAAPAVARSAEPEEKPPTGAAAEPATKEDVRTLAEEIRRLKLDIGISDVEYRSFAGMGPAASKVYYAPKGLSIGGYGEAFYRNNAGSSDACATSATACDFGDVLRLVLYTGYRFNDWIVFNSEVEFEHQRQVFVEFAYLDFLFTDRLRLRVGNLLVPMGYTNELHEPVFFHGVERPEVERNVIPSTWNENGVGLHGDLLPGLRYKLYGLGGLSAGRRPAAGSWVRNMRTRGGTSGNDVADRSLAETFAVVGSLAYERGPASGGISAYRGRSGQGQTVSANDRRVIDGDVTIVEAHAGVVWKGAQVRALAVQGQITDAGLINAKYPASGATAAANLGSRVRGAYLEGAFDVLSLRGSPQSLSPFLRYEMLKLHDQVPAGTAANPALDLDLVTTGLTWKPIPTVALKGDWNWRRSRAASDAVVHAVNVGAAFVF